MKAQSWGQGQKGHQRKRGSGRGQIIGVGDFYKDRAGLRLIWEGCKTAVKGTDISLQDRGESLEGAQNARCATAKYRKRPSQGTRMEVPRPGEIKSGQDQEKDR